MKREAKLYHKVYNHDNILKTYKKIRKTMKNKRELLKFESNLNSNINNISSLLKNKNYAFDKYNIFIIREPKYRLIMCEKIEDKIINHLVSEYILGCLDKTFIDTNVSTRINKGSKYALTKFKNYINELLCNNKELFILKIDIKKYFYNIDHNILKQKIKRKIKDKDALNLLFQIIDSTNMPYVNACINKCKNNELSNIKNEYAIKQIKSIPLYNQDKGLPIGNMTSQILAIFYLSDIDHYIKEKLKFKYYIRYMDDLIILDSDKSKLKNSLGKIIEELKKIELEVNNKTKLYKITNSINFLGYNFLYDSKLRIKCDSSSYRRIKKYLEKNKKKNYDLYYRSIRSYKGYFLYSNYIDKKYIIKEKNMYDKYKNLKNDKKDYLIFVKRGNFYYSFEEDALIMWYLLGYKVIEGKCGFPINSFVKVTNILKENNISLLALDGNNIIIYNIEVNQYQSVLSKSKESLKYDEQKREIISYVNSILEKNPEKYSKIKNILEKLNSKI